MGDMNHYKCPACGAPLVFDGGTGKLQCEFCGSSYEPKAFEEERKAQASASEEEAETSQWGVEEGMKAYSCPSCGAQVICDQTTAATSCPYCGNNAVIPRQFEGAMKPQYILPFKITKDQAIAALKEHYKGKILLPKAFKNQNQIKKIQGVYVPFWLFDRDTEGQASYEATRSSSHRDGDYIVTETRHYRISRAGGISFRKVPVDASSKMPDDYMDSIEPYNYGDLQEFSPVYMPGYLADQYDVEQKDASGRADLRCENSLESALRNTVTGYDTVITQGKNIQVTPKGASYAMLPVWLLSTRWHKNSYLFAINGQTGKLVGNLPADKTRLHSIFWSTFLITGLLLSLFFADNIGAWFMG